MAKRLVQEGADVDGKRPLVVIFHAASEVDARVRLATGPTACIVNYTTTPMKQMYSEVGKNGLPDYRDIVNEFGPKVGTARFWPVVLVGFSEGCQAVRAMILHDMQIKSTGIDGVVAIDGVHSQKPIPAQYSDGWARQIGSWQRWLGFGQWGEDKARASVFTHSEIVPPTYSSVRATLETVFSMEFGKGSGPDAPAVHRQGNVEVWSFPGNDAAAHGRQLMRQMPRAVNVCLSLLDVLDDDGAEAKALEAFLAKKGSGGFSPSDVPGVPKGQGQGQKTPTSGGGVMVPFLILTGLVVGGIAVSYAIERYAKA